MTSNISKKIVLGKVSDIPELICICRQCFPYDIKWREFFGVAKKWWEIVLSSNAAEVYVIRSENQVAAFLLLVIDEPVFKMQMNRRFIPYWLNVLLISVQPWLVWLKIRRSVENIFCSDTKKTIVLNTSTKEKLEERIWLELIAVKPAFKGRGYAKDFMQHTEERTKAAGKKAIILRVDSDNQIARKLYEKTGYLIIDKRGSYLYYSKLIDLNKV